MNIVARRLFDSARVKAKCIARKMSTFAGVEDNFGGVVVKSSNEPHERNQMEILLKESLQVWIKKGIRGVWFEVEPAFSEWIPVLIQNGFSFHHANSELSVLLRWLPLDEPSMVPDFAHNMVGVGAMVVNENNEILVVREKYRPEPHWKLPGGYVDPGESFPVAAMREVLEETSIKTEFISMVAVRHFQPRKRYMGKFGCSDVYFVAHLKPVEGTEIKICPRELSAACWMPLEQFSCHPLAFAEDQIYAKQLLAINRNGGDSLPIDCISPAHRLNFDNNRQIFLVGKDKFDP